MSKVATADEKFITLGTRGNILEWHDCTSKVELNSNQIGLTDEEYALVNVCRGDLEKAKRIIKGLEIKIKKGAKNGM